MKRQWQHADIYPNEVLKDLSHGSQLGFTGLPVSFAEVIVCTE